MELKRSVNLNIQITSRGGGKRPVQESDWLKFRSSKTLGHTHVEPSKGLFGPEVLPSLGVSLGGLRRRRHKKKKASRRC